MIDPQCLQGSFQQPGCAANRLQAEINSLHAELDIVRTAYGKLNTEANDLVGELATANERLAEAEKDAERIQWWFNRPQVDTGPGNDYLFINVARANTLEQWRAAIDAAKAREG